jgi:hypothetical protein
MVRFLKGPREDRPAGCGEAGAQSSFRRTNCGVGSGRGSEALRNLVRAREAPKQDQLRARHRLSKFLLRTGRYPAVGMKARVEGEVT